MLVQIAQGHCTGRVHQHGARSVGHFSPIPFHILFAQADTINACAGRPAESLRIGFEKQRASLKITCIAHVARFYMWSVVRSTMKRPVHQTSQKDETGAKTESACVSGTQHKQTHTRLCVIRRPSHNPRSAATRTCAAAAAAAVSSFRQRNGELFFCGRAYGNVAVIGSMYTRIYGICCLTQTRAVRKRARSNNRRRPDRRRRHQVQSQS